MTRCAARTRHLSLPTLPCQFPLRRIALEGPTVGVRLLISLVALAIGSLAANAQIIDRDTVIDRDTTLVGARVQSDVHLTIVGGVTVTVTHGPGGGLSTEGGRITINPGATIVLDTGGITVTSSEASVGSLEADGATIRTASESQQYALIVTGATTSITNCRLDGLAFGSYGTPITTDDESGYFVLQDNQVDSRYRDGLLHIGDGSADISGNTFLFEGGSRSRAVRLLVKDGDVVFENNELTLTGDSGGSAVSVSAGTNAFIEVIDNDILTTRPLGASGGISMLQCAQDNPQVLVTRNRVVGFTTALLADGCRTEISENVVDGTGAPSFS